MTTKRAECVMLFSGGTDSTCAAALCAEKYERVHLLTFTEFATKKSPIPRENTERLRKKFGNEKFVHKIIPTDRLVRKLSYNRYFRYLRNHGMFLIATPGFSSLSWHLRALIYCKTQGISAVHDGMTRELMHLPGHMSVFRKLLHELYRDYGIEFSSPVLDWEVPPSQQFVDRLIVDRHGFTLQKSEQKRTTGEYLYELGIFPHPNVKGSLFDHYMQHDCYPFVVFNIFVFWFYFVIHSEAEYAERIQRLFSEKIRDARQWIESTLNREPECASLFESARN